MRTSFRLIAGPWLLVLLLGLAACAQAPITGRTQLMLISPEEEERIGSQAFASFVQSMGQKGKILKPEESPQADKWYRQVNRVSRNILKASDWEDRYKWELVIVEEAKTVNAGVYPGGKMVVFTGMLEFVRSDDELAGVIAHELAHAVARHGGERFSQATTLQLTQAGLAAALGNSQTAGLVHAAFGLGSTFGILLPYSRLQESEADRIGLLLMAKGGYQPQALLGFWQRMGESRSGGGVEFLSTHPGYETRMENIRRWLPEARKYLENPSLPLPEKLPQGK